MGLLFAMFVLLPIAAIIIYGYWALVLYVLFFAGKHLMLFWKKFPVREHIFRHVAIGLVSVLGLGLSGLYHRSSAKSGTVRDLDGRPVAGVRMEQNLFRRVYSPSLSVSFHGSGGRTRIFRQKATPGEIVTSDASGRFQFKPLWRFGFPGLYMPISERPEVGLVVVEGLGKFEFDHNTNNNSELPAGYKFSVVPTVHGFNLVLGMRQS